MKEQLQQALVAVKNGEEERARAILAQLLKNHPDNIAGWILLSKLAQTEVQKAAFLRKVLELDPDNEYATGELSALEGEGLEPSRPILAETEEETTEPELPVASPEALPATAESESAAQAETEFATVPEAELPETAAESAVVEAEEVADAAATETAEVEEVSEVEIAAPSTGLPADLPEEEAEEASEPASATLPISEEPFDYQAQAEGDTLPPWLADEDALLAQGAAVETAENEQAPPAADVPDWVKEQPEQEWMGEEPEEISAAVTLEQAAEEAHRGAEEVVEEIASAPAVQRVQTPVSGMVIGLGILLVIVFLLLVYTALSLLF